VVDRTCISPREFKVNSNYNINDGLYFNRDYYGYIEKVLSPTQCIVVKDGDEDENIPDKKYLFKVEPCLVNVLTYNKLAY